MNLDCFNDPYLLKKYSRVLSKYFKKKKEKKKKKDPSRFKKEEFIENADLLHYL